MASEEEADEGRREVREVKFNEDIFDRKNVDGHEMRRYRIEEQDFETEKDYFKYIFKREKNAGEVNFEIVYAGPDENAWERIKWLEKENES